MRTSIATESGGEEAVQVQTGGIKLACARFETQGLSEIEARQAYLDRLDGILTTDFLEPFWATMASYQFGPLGALVLGASARTSSRTADRIANDGYNSIGVQYVSTGHARGDAHGRGVISAPGTVMILDYSRPFTITDQGQRDVVNIAVPRSLLPRIDLGAWHGATPSDATARLLCSFMATLSETLPSLPAVAGPPLAKAFVALLSSVMTDEHDPMPMTPAEHLIRRAESLVDTWIGSADLGPAWLVRKLAVSRTELYAALERFGGVARFIMQRRLQGARAALENPHDPRQIKAIAFAFGFSSEAQFSRAFRTNFGTTASAIRRDAKTAALAEMA